jgi:flagellar protein FlaF
MMTAYGKLGAYNTAQRQKETDRELESRALLTCASLLAAAQTNGDRTQYTDALKKNQRLWTIFQVALCDPENKLPTELKAIILNLSRYVDRVSFRAIAEYTPAALSSLIDLNRALATGLSKRAEREADLSATQAPEVPASVMTSI